MTCVSKYSKVPNLYRRLSTESWRMKSARLMASLWSSSRLNPLQRKCSIVHQSSSNNRAQMHPLIKAGSVGSPWTPPYREEYRLMTPHSNLFKFTHKLSTRVNSKCNLLQQGHRTYQWWLILAHRHRVSIKVEPRSNKQAKRARKLQKTQGITYLWTSSLMAISSCQVKVIELIYLL